MPGWTHDSPPPLVFTGSSPPGAMRPPVTKVLALALGAIAEVFEEQDRVDREGVIKLDGIHVGWLVAGHFERTGTTLGGGGHGQIRHAGDHPVMMLHGATKQMDRYIRAILGTVRPRHDNRTATIRHQATVKLGQRVGDQARIRYVIDRQISALEGFRVELGPLARRHRNFRKLIARAAVLVHIARGRQRIRRDRVARAVDESRTAAARRST